MKTIGLLGGMSWESTVGYYRAINESVKNILGGLHSAKIAIYSVDFDPIDKLQHEGNWEGTARILSEAALRVQSAGADFLLICTNTMHKVAPQIEESIKIPLLHIADATAEVLVHEGIQTVGLLVVISDAHQGLKNAVGAVLPGAAWQRCRTHFMRNLLCKVPKKAQPAVATLVRSIFAQSDKEQVLAQHTQVVERLLPQFADAANLLIDAGPDLLAFADFPQKHWRQIWSNNPQERLNREVRRRTDVVGIFQNRMAIIRLVGSVLAEQNDEWAVSRRYMSLESIAEAIQGLQRTKSEELDDSPALPSAA